MKEAHTEAAGSTDTLGSGPNLKQSIRTKSRRPRLTLTYQFCQRTGAAWWLRSWKPRYKRISKKAGNIPLLKDYQEVIQAMKSDFNSSVFGKEKEESFEGAVSKNTKGFD